MNLSEKLVYGYLFVGLQLVPHLLVPLVLLLELVDQLLVLPLSLLGVDEERLSLVFQNLILVSQM